MFYIIGVIVVFGSVIFGYTLHGGNLNVLYQPSEFIIILGAALGSVIIGNPISHISKTAISVKYLIQGSGPYTKKDYMDLLLFFFNAFKLMKIKSSLDIEKHINDPDNSILFKLAPTINKAGFIKNFIIDNFRIIIMGTIDSPHHLEEILDKEIDLFHNHENIPSNIFLTLSESLPALGIVAAVLGVIVTMKSIMEPPDVLGALIGAALVGTFLGVLTSYGFFGPMANFLYKYTKEKAKFAECIKIGFISHLSGQPPIITVEFMRKSIEENLKPSFDELDNYINENSIKFTDY